jgi:hypothetical protein
VDLSARLWAETSGVCITNWWWSMPGHPIQQGLNDNALLGAWVFHGGSAKEALFDETRPLIYQILIRATLDQFKISFQLIFIFGQISIFLSTHQLNAR